MQQVVTYAKGPFEQTLSQGSWQFPETLFALPPRVLAMPTAARTSSAAGLLLEGQSPLRGGLQSSPTTSSPESCRGRLLLPLGKTSSSLVYSQQQHLKQQQHMLTGVQLASQLMARTSR